MGKKVKVDENWKIGLDEYKCPFCDAVYSIHGIGSHVYFKHMEDGIEKIKNIGMKSSKNRKGKPGHAVSDDVKKKISEGMKRAHSEGRANNWQDSKRKKGYNSSYPEQFFQKVIENELQDKNYIFQYRVSKYSLDFAWPAKKLYIEIDGSQHENSKEYDIKRDNFLFELGWRGLRIDWSYFFNNTQLVIMRVKNFIDNGCILLEKSYETGSNVIKLEGKIKVYKKNRSKIIQGNKGTKTITCNYFCNDFYFLQERELKEYIRKKQILENCNKDFKKHGCFKKIGYLWGITGQTAARYMKKYFYDYL